MNTFRLLSLLERPHFLLAGHLLMLHVLAFGGWKIPAVRLLWVAALGLFLIWQPFVSGERRVSVAQVLGLVFIVLVTTWFLGPWLLLMWCGALAATIGGRVLWTELRAERAGYLLAFGYLIGVVVLGVVPEISSAVSLDPLPRDALGRFMPLVLPFLVFFPARPPQRRAADSYDLFYGMLVFLVLAVFVLGSLAFMLVGQVSYVESLFKTSFTVASALFLVAWAWNPRAGFSGIGSVFSRYVLSVGMPLDQWLEHLADESERQLEPGGFIEAVMSHLHNVSWVLGASWQVSEGRGERGEQTAYRHDYKIEGVLLSVYFRHQPSTAMRWHVEWLLRLAAEFYLVKRHTHELQRMGYLQAVYETGARVTHDVKNILQTLQSLCYVASQPRGDPAQLTSLFGRQLPQITERLRVTLDKLQTPNLSADVQLVDAALWWSRLQERYAHAGLAWHGDVAGLAVVPGSLFDSVAENLLQNALAKRQRHPGLAIAVTFGVMGFEVCDDGDPLAETLAGRIFLEPVGSEDGLGIGLYHAAQQAKALGYQLFLSGNVLGRVSFRLSVRPD
jgi:signal transduction histidine kinase